MHFILCLAGELKARTDVNRSWVEAAGILTLPDAQHEIDARGREVLLVFLDPESEAGTACQSLTAGALRPISTRERDALIDVDPRKLVGAQGLDWTRRAVEELGGSAPAERRRIHPQVRQALRLLAADTESYASLEALAAALEISPSRLMHVFTESLGVPVRPYFAWLRLQRAAAAIVSGLSLSEAAHSAGFADAAHMSRTFRRMFGVPPSRLRPP